MNQYPGDLDRVGDNVRTTVGGGAAPELAGWSSREHVGNTHDPPADPTEVCLFTAAVNDCTDRTVGFADNSSTDPEGAVDIDMPRVYWRSVDVVGKVLQEPPGVMPLAVDVVGNVVEEPPAVMPLALMQVGSGANVLQEALANVPLALEQVCSVGNVLQEALLASDICGAPTGLNRGGVGERDLADFSCVDLLEVSDAPISLVATLSKQALTVPWSVSKTSSRFETSCVKRKLTSRCNIFVAVSCRRII